MVPLLEQLQPSQPARGWKLKECVSHTSHWGLTVRGGQRHFPVISSQRRRPQLHAGQGINRYNVRFRCCLTLDAALYQLPGFPDTSEESGRNVLLFLHYRIIDHGRYEKPFLKAKTNNTKCSLWIQCMIQHLHAVSYTVSTMSCAERGTAGPTGSKIPSQRSPASCHHVPF